jgi:hypothetical protein
MANLTVSMQRNEAATAAFRGWRRVLDVSPEMPIFAK